MKKIRHIITGLTLMIGLLTTTLVPASQVAAVDLFQACQGQGNPVCGARGDDTWVLLNRVIGTLLLLIGIVAVIYIIIGGYKYITANGDASKIGSAKNTIMYAVIGLVVAMAAYAIVTFVITNI